MQLTPYTGPVELELPYFSFSVNTDTMTQSNTAPEPTIIITSEMKQNISELKKYYFFSLQMLSGILEFIYL